MPAAQFVGQPVNPKTIPAGAEPAKLDHSANILNIKNLYICEEFRFISHLSKKPMFETLILASRNKDKIKELRLALEGSGVGLKSSYDFPELEEVQEDKKTLAGNALKKARYTFQATGLPALSDDTGLEVDALDGRPGVYSARYSGEKASYQQNMEKLLLELSSVEMENRTAQFRTVIAFVIESESYTFEGVCRGRILEEPRGIGGFGYDPVFQPTGFDRTFSELDEKVKNEISHRGKALSKFTTWLQKEAENG
jgi:XTP/dITP diphosphohydrolase